MDFSHSDCLRAAQIIYDGFEQYNRQFKRITDRAKRRFEQRDWNGQIKDVKERVELYDKWCTKVQRSLRRELGPRVKNPKFWESIRMCFGSRLVDVPDAGFMKTFFNSTSRRTFGTVGINNTLEFKQPPPDEGLESLAKRRYPCWRNMEETFRRVLRDFRCKLPFEDIDRDASLISNSVRNRAERHSIDTEEFHRFEFIDSHFFQGARAYLVGRVLHDEEVFPIVIALENTGGEIRVDATLVDEQEVSIIFSYTRSYYFADPTSVIGAVLFLASILPRKPMDELYTVLGRLRQGKTERYKTFANHLKHTNDQFVFADGDKGLVMQVFTLPSFNLVFKIIRDKFGFPKNTTREKVMAKYRLVSNHDHAGRLIDTQEFLNMELSKDRFEPALLKELVEGASNSTRMEGDNLVLNHVYVERRVRPLNLYIREAEEDAAINAILDYGQAMKDLAETNIFPGDLLLKNFGVTASQRVVFYDYDEVQLVTECRFMELPEDDDDFETMRPGAGRLVGPNDIFPEEFIRFLAMDRKLRKIFMHVHSDLMTADYWRDVKHRRLRGEIKQVIPYIRQYAPADLTASTSQD
ncbi:MAG: isocitrate dehydrogenase kinase/phosphatase [Parasphingorhabdus sp.]|jgi:isocitrate dehydrogenase kinase/phosphatase